MARLLVEDIRPRYVRLVPVTTKTVKA